MSFSKSSGPAVSVFITVFFSLMAGSVWASGAESAGAQVVSISYRMMMLVLQLGVMLFAARLGHMVFDRLKLPGVLGELCAGIVIGPYALGQLAFPGFSAGLFPEFFIKLAEGGYELRFVVSPELYGICMLAAVILLFLVGLETDFKLFLRYSVAGSLVGLGGVIASFAVGDLLGVWLLPWVVPGTYSAVNPLCVFLGVMCTATSVSITARILSEMKKLDSPEGVTILAGAVIDDVLGIIMLAIGMGVIASTAKNASAGVEWSAIGWIAVKAIGLWLIATCIGVLSAHKISSFLKKMGGHDEIAILAVGLALIVAGLFEKAQLSMIIGSYVMGLSLSRTDISHMVRERLKPVFDLLVPAFFVVMGMMVDLKLLFDPKVLAFGLIYTVLAVLAKIIGCGLPSLFCGFNVRGAFRIGMGMVPRGEVALIVAGIGLAAGFLTKEVFGIAVLMTLLTTLLAPPLLVMAFNHKGAGLRHGHDKTAATATAPVIYKFPNEEIATLLTHSVINSLSKEGFFVHELNPSEGLYQAQKNDLNLGIRCKDARIEFEAPCDTKQIIRLMMIEVIADFEQTLNKLRMPLDAKLSMELPKEELARFKRHRSLNS